MECRVPIETRGDPDGIDSSLLHGEWAEPSGAEAAELPAVSRTAESLDHCK